MSGSICIYGLVDDCDPDAEIRYVGKTRLSRLECRVRQHINEIDRRHTPKNSWIKAVNRRGSTIKAVILEVCDDSEWEERERFWIAHYRQITRLTNVCDGGDSGPDMTGHRHTAEVKAIISKSGIGRKPSAETLAKRSAALKGRIMSQEWLEKIRKTKMENYRNGDRSWEIGIKAAIASNIGRKHSPERVERVAAAQRGKRRCTSSLMSRRKAVVCVETGTWFSSLAEATRRCGYASSAIGQSIDRNGQCGGFHWKLSEQKVL